MDEVFGEENFIKDLIINTSEGGGQAKYVINGHENLLVYAKNLSFFDNLKRPKDIRGKKVIIDKELYWIQEDAIRKEFGKYGNLHYEEILEFRDANFKNKIDAGLLNNEYVLIPKDYGKSIIGVLRKVSEDFSKFHSIINIDGISKHLTADGIREIEDIFSVSKGNSPFSNPKPLDLLKRVVLSATFNTKSDLVVDFFGGSGTTGDAVMQLNMADGGYRKFILVQLPEAIDPKKSKVAYDFVKDELKTEPTIFEITKERLLRAAKKINAGLDEKNAKFELKIIKLKSELQTEETKAEIESLKLQKIENSKLKTQNCFKVFETMPIWEDYDFEADELDNQTKLFDESKLTEDDINALLTTWKTYDGIALTQDLETIDLVAYNAYYNNGKLYLMNKGFTTDNLKNLLETIDSDKKFNPTSIIAFGYHFESKNLRELSENVKSYTNKKKIDIDFITRY
jgi:adenine-specific DNA-methyltransferase